MKCFFCGSELSSVIDKRTVKGSGVIRRRRECHKCHKRYTTYERICEYELYVIKRSGKKELFSRDKIKAGIERALEKRPAYEQGEEILDKIINCLKTKGKKEIESKLIGKAVLAELKKIDQVAYLRFASVYRNFETSADFEKELESLNLKKYA